MKNLPKTNAVYSTLQVETELKLLDSPFLRVQYKGNYYPIQTSHLIPEDSYLKNAEIAALKWKYIKTTAECIPLFNAVDSEEVLKHCIIQEVPYFDEIEIMIQFKGDIRNFLEEAKQYNF